MVNLFLDFETGEYNKETKLYSPELDATKPIIGVTKIENAKKHKVFYDSNKLWKYIKDLGVKEAIRGKTLNVYHFNGQYDSSCYVNLRDKHLKMFSNRPFIWTYELSPEELSEYGIKSKYSKQIINFLDVMSIYPKMRLMDVGKLIGTEKQDFDLSKPKVLNEGLTELEEYCLQDVIVTEEALIKIKNKLRVEGVNIRRLYTINQIGRNYLFNKWLKMDDEYLEPYFWNKKVGQARRTFRKKEVHAAYRGGRCEAWKTGLIKADKVNYYDVNSLYPYSIANMRTPNLKSERKVLCDQEYIKDTYKTNFIFKIGLARVMMKNVTNSIGLLQVRTEKDNFYPIPGQIFIGTYTNDEILKAVDEGYKLIDIEWFVHYDEAPNPFKEIMENMYQKRKESGDKFDNWFYKMMMNTGIGKLAQHRNGQMIKADDLEETDAYLKKNYEIIHHTGYTNFFKGEEKESYDKPYYMPIIPTLCNAYARIYMYNVYKKANKRIYTDTDSIMCEDNLDDVIPIGEGLGEFEKIEVKDDINIVGRKTYRIDDRIKVSGVSHSRATKDEFDSGKIDSKQQITISTAKDIKDVGKFRQEVRDLQQIGQNYKDRKNKLNNELVLIDHDIDNINYFIQKLRDMI